ncbi:MAG: hypothetical protein B6243_13320 [Anaerolineaceae bacterium 4572_5.2]|nr:MAG: hypothetical protein B6243_13320 [Anaerolineaceae bacterium 4572_5.2]
MENYTMDFQVFFYMVIGIFGLAGFMRGWWKEAITTGLLVFLLAMLKYPELAESVVGLLNQGLDLLSELLIKVKLLEHSIAHIDSANSQFYILTLIFFVIISYFIGKSAAGTLNITVGGRMFGAVLGLLNGFIILSLFREYILQRYLPNTGMSTAATPTTVTSVAVSNVPPETIMDGAGIWILIIGGALLFFFAISSRLSYTSGKVKTRAPIGYK